MVILVNCVVGLPKTLGHSALAMVKRYQHVLPGLTSPRPSAWTAQWGADRQHPSFIDAQ